MLKRSSLCLVDKDCSFFGAGDRARTGTLFPARDFKSLASANSTTPANVIIILAPNPASVKEKGVESGKTQLYKMAYKKMQISILIFAKKTIYLKGVCVYNRNNIDFCPV